MWHPLSERSDVGPFGRDKDLRMLTQDQPEKCRSRARTTNDEEGRGRFQAWTRDRVVSLAKAFRIEARFPATNGRGSGSSMTGVDRSWCFRRRYRLTGPVAGFPDSQLVQKRKGASQRLP